MIGVIGLGFVGLTTALGFAHKGQRVFGFDVDKEKIDLLRKGKIPFHEPHLKDQLSRHLGKSFIPCDSLGDVIAKCEIIFYCVGTPSGDDGRANLDFLKKAISDTLLVSSKARGQAKTLVIKSTVPPSSTQDIIAPLIEKAEFKIGKDIYLTNNPEFLREGCAWEDFTAPDRIVIGASDAKSHARVEGVYKSFRAPIFKVSWNTAEFAKYLSNSFLATLISYSNEMAMIADKIGGVEIADAFKILHQDKRWSGAPAKMASYAYPGCGFGGYCLPKDALALQGLAQSKGYDAELIRSVLAVNRGAKEFITQKTAAAANKNDTIGVLGLAFKPNSDDVRESPAKDIIQMLLKRGYKNIIAYDPLAMDNFKIKYDLPIRYSNSLKDVVKASRVLLLLTSWAEFQAHSELIRTKKLIDGRYFLSAGEKKIKRSARV